jgi:mono/diheme cytochrome c family protein
MQKAFERTVVRSAIVCVALFCAPQFSSAQQGEGEKLFKQICVACHTIDKGKLVGPDLANVHKRRPEDWLIKYIKSSQSVIKSGDEYAVKLYEEYNKQLMPDNNYTDAQVMAIISYIAANSPDDGSEVETAQSVSEDETLARPITEENIRSGQRLFVGKVRFANGGPTCNSCHNVKLDGVMAGGALAKDLTDSYSRLGGVGVRAMMASTPFPAMGQAFEERPLTNDEIFDLTAFLQHVDSERESQRSPWYGARLFFAGLGGSVLLVGFFACFWIRSKKRSVNHAIYERQVKSTWEDLNDSQRMG